MKTKLIAFNIRELDDTAKELTKVTVDSSIWQLRLAGVAKDKPSIKSLEPDDIRGWLFAHNRSSKLNEEQLSRLMLIANNLTSRQDSINIGIDILSALGAKEELRQRVAGALAPLETKKPAQQIPKKTLFITRSIRQAVLPQLIETLSQLEPEWAIGRAAALEELAILGATEAIEQITECLFDQETWPREKALNALAALDATGKLAVIATKLNDEKASVRQAAADALVYLRRDEADLAESIFALYAQTQKPELPLALARWHSGILTREYFLKDA